MLRPSEACYSLIKEFEDNVGFHVGHCTQLSAYLCPAGIWTIGWGHTGGVSPGMRITAQQADEFLVKDVNRVAAVLDSMLPKAELTQGQQDALISLAYNMNGGPWALPRRAPKLWAALNAGEVPQAAHELLDMDHALVHGKVEELAGLKLRREKEARMFLGEAA